MEGRKEGTKKRRTEGYHGEMIDLLTTIGKEGTKNERKKEWKKKEILEIYMEDCS
jgi:hypothetical protein